MDIISREIWEMEYFQNGDTEQQYVLIVHVDGA